MKKEIENNTKNRLLDYITCFIALNIILNIVFGIAYFIPMFAFWNFSLEEDTFIFIRFSLILSVVISFLMMISSEYNKNTKPPTE